MTQDNQIIALDAKSGELIWQESGSATQAGVFGVAAPAAGQGTVIAGYSSGELSAYRYENGRTLWADALARTRSEEHTSELQSLMRISYAVFCLKKNKLNIRNANTN